MSADDIRTLLRRACEEVEQVCEDPATSPVEDRLVGIAELLRHVADDTSSDPEAVVHPGTGPLETIQYRLTEAIDEVDDGDAGDHLTRAREEIESAIGILEDQWRKQHLFPSDESR